MVVEIFIHVVYYTKFYVEWFRKKHLSVPQAVFLDQYYTLTDFWLYAQIKKADTKIVPKSSLHAGLIYVLVYAYQHVTRRMVARNLIWYKDWFPYIM